MMSGMIMTKNQWGWIAAAMFAACFVIPFNGNAGTSSQTNCLSRYRSNRETCDSAKRSCDTNARSHSCARVACSCNYDVFIGWAACVQATGGEVAPEHLELARQAYLEAIGR
jgi:hypothetical protein